jgi:hypothetical protein
MARHPATLLLFLAFTLWSGTFQAQVNDKGVFHISLGIDGGVHGTAYTQNIRILGLPITESSRSSAVTMLVPLHVQYGLSPLVSLGFYLEGGRYLDSSATRINTISLIGLQPRFHIVNRDRFTWIAMAQLGSTALQINDSDALGSFSSTYRGPHFGIGSAVGFYFTDRLGVQVHLRYLGTSLDLAEFARAGSAVSRDVFDASLNTVGLSLQAAMAVRF